MTPEELFEAAADASNVAAREQFFNRYVNVVRATLSRKRYTNDPAVDIDDLTQTVFVRLWSNFRALLRFKRNNNNSDFGYVSRVASSALIDHIRKNSRAVDSFCNTAESPDISQDMNRDILFGEIAAHLEAVTKGAKHAGRDRLIFAFYFRAGFNAQEISRLPEIGLSTKGVESVIHKLAAAIRKSLQLSDKPVHTKADADGESL
jgi:RNA polymerase sigma-70 factor (ECF subfamily)